MNDTIAAISTAFGEAAIALLRLSGPRAVEIADSVFRSKQRASEIPSRLAQFGSIYGDDRKIDDVLLTVFRAPASYTGEDVVEIACHGGVLVSRRILELLLRSGARSAEPGEFTQRAYLNRKLDLTQAEAVMDLIGAQTDLALRAATEQLAGSLGDRIRALRTSVLETLAQVEAYIDFPEEDIEPDTGVALRSRIAAALESVDELLATAGQGKVLREGLRTVLSGAPNVGKSSLLNRLLGYERAIVSHHPGTTRDVLEETINVRGIPVRLMDTAGLRDSTDELELAGMERTRRALENADLVLRIAEAHRPSADQNSAAELQTREESCSTLLVLNKSDLGVHTDWEGIGSVRISCTTGEGMDSLLEAIAERALGGAAKSDWSVAINARHQACLETARNFLGAALDAFDRNLSPEFVAEELRAALGAIGDVVGRVGTEELLGVIFSQFCIGK